RGLVLGAARRRLWKAPLGLPHPAVVLLASRAPRPGAALGRGAPLSRGPRQPPPRGPGGSAIARASSGPGDRSMTVPGRFIVFEGVDAAGTSAQPRLLSERLQRQGRTVHPDHRPSEGSVALLRC